MGRFTAGNNADPDRLQRVVMDAKQRLIGVSLDTGRHIIAPKRQQVYILCLAGSGLRSPLLLAFHVQVDVQALAAQVEAKRHAKEQEKAKEQ